MDRVFRYELDQRIKPYSSHNFILVNKTLLCLWYTSISIGELGRVS